MIRFGIAAALAISAIPALAQDSPAVPQQHRATVPSSGHASSPPHAAARAEHADALPTGHPRASPHGGMVGRNHSVQRSFGTPAHSPCASHIGGGGGADAVSGVVTPTTSDSASWASVVRKDASE